MDVAAPAVVEKQVGASPEEISVPTGGVVDLVSYSAIVFTIGLFSSGM